MSLGTAPLRQLPILILISFDGFKHDYLSSTLSPNLFDLSKQGTIGHMESLYITKTFPNHFSMVTGLYEDEHEIINNKMFDPRLNSTFKPSEKSKEWWNPSGKTIPIWIANEIYGTKFNQRRYSGSMMFPGSTTPYQNLRPTYLREYSKSANWTDNVETVISWITNTERPANLVTMYFDDPDTTAHVHGPWGDATLEAVRRVDSAAGYLVKRLREEGLADETNIIFVSDHGMSEVKNLIYLSDLGVDTENFDLHGNSPDWSVFVKQKKRHMKKLIFKELLRASEKGHYTIYRRTDIPLEYHYSKSPRIGDFFILADEKYDLYEDKPKTIKDYPEIWGNHGWKPKNRDMRPLFVAYGPSFKRDYYHENAFPNIDLFPLMVFLLGLPTETLPNNGSLARIVDVIDVGHFADNNNSLSFAYVIILVAMFFVISGAVVTMIAGSGKKTKKQVDFDDLAPGLDIDLSYYLHEECSDRAHLISTYSKK